MRKEVKWFAEKMEEKLASKDKQHPNGWADDSAEHLATRLRGKLDSLEQGIWYEDKNIVELATDIANFAMMIADKSK